MLRSGAKRLPECQTEKCGVGVRDMRAGGGSWGRAGNKAGWLAVLAAGTWSMSEGFLSPLAPFSSSSTNSSFFLPNLIVPFLCLKSVRGGCVPIHLQAINNVLGSSENGPDLLPQDFRLHPVHELGHTP